MPIHSNRPKLLCWIFHIWHCFSITHNRQYFHCNLSFKCNKILAEKLLMQSDFINSYDIVFLFKIPDTMWCLKTSNFHKEKNLTTLAIKRSTKNYRNRFERRRKHRILEKNFFLVWLVTGWLVTIFIIHFRFFFGFALVFKSIQIIEFMFGC